MAFVGICGGFENMLGSLLPILGISSLATAFMIAIGYMLGEMMHNPKINEWAKTEGMQIFVSIGAVLILMGAADSFCGIYIDDLGDIFGISITDHLNLFDAAQAYFVEAAVYIHSGLEATRYHLGTYNMLDMYGRWMCGSENAGLNVILCLFGSSIGLGGGSGISISPLSGYGIAGAGMHIAFSSQIFAYLSVLNYLMILRYAYSGMGFFLLPIGIMLRSVPFMRQLGSLLISLTFAFVLVYPLVLSVFYLDIASDDSVLAPKSGDMWDAVEAYKDADVESSNPYDKFESGTKEFELSQFTGHAILVGVFVPTLALLAAIGSLMYVNRFLGEEIDLSKVIQMV